MSAARATGFRLSIYSRTIDPKHGHKLDNSHYLNVSNMFPVVLITYTSSQMEILAALLLLVTLKRTLQSRAFYLKN